MSVTIVWKPIPNDGEPLAVGFPEIFILQMQTAFPGEWPIRLEVKHIERLEGMAAACTMVGNPYIALLQNLKRYRKIEVWPKYDEPGDAKSDDVPR
jgi:hypothetical protein